MPLRTPFARRRFPFCAPFFRGVSGVKIHETREQSWRRDRRGKKSDKGEGGAREQER